MNATQASQMKSAGPALDNNFYRKVSKYDLDANRVDFKALYKERDRQITENGKIR